MLNKQKLKDLRYIFARNVFLLTNGIIFAVVFLLFVFGDTQAAVFLGLVLAINILLGLGQDIRAWLALENLQLLTAPHVVRLKNDQSEESVLIEEIKEGDLIKSKMGDQIPCDGVLVHAESFELNEGLITGESASLPRALGDHVLAGSIVTSGEGIIRVAHVFSKSRIARMTEGIKTYSINLSPLQREVGTIVTYSGYVLMVCMLFAAAEGVFLHEPNILIIKSIGALASTIVPQGLVFAMTLLFAYGAAHLFNRNVLLQEINATEKLGRMRNLCMDKTGTLTENMLVVERMETPVGVSHEEAEVLTNAYLCGSKETSQTMTAIAKFLPTRTGLEKIVDAVSFSSWRQYGAVKIGRADDRTAIIIAGVPELFLPYLADEDQKIWLNNFLHTETKEGKRIFSLALSSEKELPDTFLPASLSLVAVFVIDSKLRPGVKEAIDFFQKREVHIRIISGDSPETVRAIALSAGVAQCDLLTTGSIMEKWTPEDFRTYAKDYTIFARTLPEQKEKIIEALKFDGFTAMIGDGANDALAIKKADLGIAMWEGAPATRQIASVVLLNNSFAALPGGVELADSIIKNAEIFASIFFDFAFVGFFLFLIVSIWGYPYPLSPLNITLINYFIIGIPGILVSYWTIRPTRKTIAPSTQRFLVKILPFTIASALLQAIVIAALFTYSPDSTKVTGSNIYVLLSSIVVGAIFFLFTPWVYRGVLEQSQVREMGFLVAVEVILFVIIFHIPFLLRFFDVSVGVLSLVAPGYTAEVIAVYVFLQYLLAHFFIARMNSHL